jgi:catechol 2,3-dioxygenase-like lactoylglutathione lyase family enzyme
VTGGTGPSGPSGPSGVVKAGHVIVPADDLDAVTSFWTDRLGLSLRFRDGDRYVAVTDGTVTFGLAAPSEQPDASRVVASFEVHGLDDLVAAWRAEGLDVGDPFDGSHERKAVVRDPAGNAVVVYERLT